MFYETHSAPLSLVLFSNLNLILLVLNEKNIDDFNILYFSV